MGMDLRGEGGAFRFSRSGWAAVLGLAYDYGWQPRGTEAPTWYPDYDPDSDPSHWDGTYFANNYQHVTSEDAKAIAEALAKALPNIPEQCVMGDRMVVCSDGTPGIKGDAQYTPLEYFSGGEGKEHVREFIAYCEKGDFCIG